MKGVLLLLVAFSVLTSAQRCFDGNTQPGDGCSNNQTEPDWSCPLNGPCKCLCPASGNRCACNWVTSQEKVTVQRVKYLDRVALELKRGQNAMLGGFRFTTSNDSKVALEGSTVNTTGINWDDSLMEVVQWYGSPIRFLTNLDRVAFECPHDTVPTKLYFRRAGCNEQGVMALRDKKNRRTAPPCLANSQSFNEGLSLVAECRPNPAIINSNWKWVDAGVGAPISGFPDLSRLGGMCDAGFAMTGLYFKRWGCNSNLWWNQHLSRSSLPGRCAANATGDNGRPPTEGLIVRLKCTRYATPERPYQECNKNNPCHGDALCVANPTFGARCQCRPGYDGDGYTCSPINRCEDGTHTCAPSPIGFCSNTGPGNFTCGCAPGYTKNSLNHCLRNTKPANVAAPVTPGFRAVCVIEGADIRGTFTLEATEDARRNPMGVKISHNITGNLAKVSTWDINTHLVHGTGRDCIASGGVYRAVLGDGALSQVGALTAKWGPLTLNQGPIYDSELRLWGDNSIVGRSIVLKDTVDSDIACCQIMLRDGMYTPVRPTYDYSGVNAVCNFADGRSIRFQGLTEKMGNGTAVLGGHSVGSEVLVNPITVVRLSENFNAAASLTNWFVGLPKSLAPTPEVGTCLGTRILGGAGKLGLNQVLVYKQDNVRPFKAIRVKFTYWAFNTWDGEEAYLSFDDERRGKEYKLWTVAPRLTDAAFKTGFNPNDCNQQTRYATYTVDKTYYFQESLTNIYLEFGSNLNEHPSNESWGLASFSLWLQPVDGYEQLYLNDFAGNFARQAFRYGPPAGTSWIVPPIQMCPATPNYFMLGGINTLVNDLVLEYNNVPVPSTTFHKLGISFNFYYQGTWPANQEMFMDIKNTAGSWVNVWRQPTPAGTALTNCNGTSVRLLAVGPVYANLPFAIDRVSLRWRKGGTAGAFGISKFKVEILATPRFRNVRSSDFSPASAARTVGWEYSPSGADGTWTTPTIGECNWKDTPSAWRALSTDYILGGASTMGRGWRLRYRAPTVAHRRAIVYFQFWFWRSWDGERAYMIQKHPSADGRTTLTTERWRRKFNFNWARGLLCPGHGWRDDTQKAWVTYNMPTLVQPMTSVHFEWYTDLDQDGPDEAFGIGEFSLWTYPVEEEVVMTVAPSGDFSQFRLRNRAGVTAPVPPPTVCGGERVLGVSISWENLITFSASTTRPFEQAIVNFNFWFLDSWDGEWGRMDIVHSGRNYVSWLDTNTAPHTWTAESQAVCGPAGYPFANYDVRRSVSVPVTLDSATNSLNLEWQTTLDQGFTDEAWGISSVSVDILPLIPTSVVVDQMGSSTSKTGITALSPTGTSLPFTYSSCGAGLFLWPKVNGAAGGNVLLGSGRRLRLNLLHNQDFIALRVFFTGVFTNSWDAEYAWLDFNSDKVLPATGKPESLRLWRNQRFFEGAYSGNAPWGANNCVVDTIRWNDATLTYSLESQRLATATRRVQLDWGCDVDEDSVDNEGFGLVGWKVVAVHPSRAPQLVEELHFSNNNIDQLLTNWKVVSAPYPTISNWRTAAGSAPSVSECKGPRGGVHYLLGAGILAKDRHLVYAGSWTNSFTKAYISFRYFFLRSWDQEVGRVYVNGQLLWEISSIHSKHTPDLKCPIQGQTSSWGDTFSDATIVFTSATPIRELTVVFTSTLDQTHDDESFSISYFKIELETPKPSYKIQDGCTSNRAIRKDNGYAYQKVTETKGPLPTSPVVVSTVSWAQGEMTNKHGDFDTATFRDFDISLAGPSSVVGHEVGLYQSVNDTRPLRCCTITLTANSVAPVAPRKIAKKTAACVINRPDIVEGEIAVVSPGNKEFGSKVEINLRFYGEQRTSPHRVFISPRGTTDSEIKATGCPTAIYNPDSWIGPQAVTPSNPLAPGQMRFPDSPDGSIFLGDITSKFSRIPGTSTTALVFNDGQIQLTGAHSIVGRTVVVTDGAGAPLACCTLGLGLVGAERDPWAAGTLSRRDAIDYPDFDPIPDKGEKKEAVNPPPPPPPGTPPPPAGDGDTGISISEARHVIPGAGREHLNESDWEWMYFNDEDDGLTGGQIAGIVIGSVAGAIIVLAGLAFALSGGAGGGGTGDYVAL